jgi:hypothetical protein
VVIFATFCYSYQKLFLHILNQVSLNVFFFMKNYFVSAAQQQRNSSATAAQQQRNSSATAAQQQRNSSATAAQQQ